MVKKEHKEKLMKDIKYFLKKKEKKKTTWLYDTKSTNG